MSDKLILIAGKVPRMTAEDMAAHMQALGRQLKRQAVIDAMLAEAVKG